MVLDFSHAMHLVSECGSKTIEVVSPYSDIVEVPVYCNNRICDHPGCIEHRRGLFERKHRSQMDAMRKNIRRPRSWVFTGWRLPYPIDKGFCQEKLKFLFFLLKSKKYGSVTLFSIHMEIKLHQDSWYLHFHVVSGGFVDFFYLRELWGRWVRYEKPIHQDDLEAYISKYATKVPVFSSSEVRYHYFCFVYKTQLTRYSHGVSDKRVSSGWYLYKSLEYEAYCCFKSDVMWKGGFCKFVEDYENRHLSKQDHPPDIENYINT